MGTGSSKTKKTNAKRKTVLLKPLKKEQEKIIFKQQEKSLCQITTKDSKASGFLCKIPNVKNPVLITANNVLGEAQIKPGEEINIYFTDDDDRKINKTIKID